MDVYEMTQEQFTAAMVEKGVTPQFIYQYAVRIYDALTSVMGQDCSDSVLREWAFEWASTELGIDYEVIYERWLGDIPPLPTN